MSAKEGATFVTDQLIYNIDFNNPLSYPLCKNLIMNSNVPFSDGRSVAEVFNQINLYNVTSSIYTEGWYSWSSSNGNSDLFSVKSGEQYTFSFYAKPGNTNSLLIKIIGGGGELYSNPKAIIIPANGGRVFTTLTANTNVDAYAQISIQTPAGGSKTFSMGGVQLERGGFMSNYFPTTGKIAYDISGRNRKTTFYNSPMTTYSSLGTLKFNGSNQYGVTYITGNNESDFYSSSFTLGAFAKLDVANSSDSWLYDMDYIGYRLWGGNNTVFMVRGPSAAWDSISYSFNVGQWYYVCATMIDNGTSNNVSIYINGSLVGTYSVGQKNFAAFAGVDHFSTAAHYNTATRKPFTIGNIHQYKKVLTAAEVAQNFNALRGRYGL